MACYICDPDRVRPESLAMPDDEWDEGCEDCFSAFVDAFILPYDDELPTTANSLQYEPSRANPHANAGDD